jgi:hypothetical protein
VSDLAARKSELFAEMPEGEQRWESNAAARDQSALGRRRIVNSMRPPESSRRDSISVI